MGANLANFDEIYTSRIQWTNGGKSFFIYMYFESFEEKCSSFFKTPF